MSAARWRTLVSAARWRTLVPPGISHQHWHNTASSWLGPSRRVIAMARLTTAVSRSVELLEEEEK